VFSGEKLTDADVHLGPEMKSTGEVLGIDKDLDKAIYKAFDACGVKMITEGSIYVSLRDIDKAEGLQVIKDYIEMGFNLYASYKTAKYFNDMGVVCEALSLKEVPKFISKGQINMIINTPTRGNDLDTEGFKMRRKAAEYRLPCFTCLDTAKVFLTAIRMKRNNEYIEPVAINEFFKV
jgi:carbamoyl-phosphate synthase large subunit